MCGICGIVGGTDPAAARKTVERMVATLRHRGPDGEGVWSDARATLGHARLSIIDVAGGHQPLSNEDGNVWVSFNGEIYNYRELRARLEGSHRFATRSDTEVLVHLYEERGEAFVEELRGMFAIALWDARAGKLLLARDPLGKKPLFYAADHGRFLFASEPRAILAALDGRPHVDSRAIDDLLAVRWLEGRRSGYEEIERLLPGEMAVLQHGRIEHRAWWSPPRPDPGPPRSRGNLTLADAAEEFRARFDRAVARRLESEVPLGLLLSGGIDSTAVLESMSRQTREPVKTFTTVFSREEESEGPFARAAAEHFRSEHQEFALVEADLVAHVEEALALLDEPFADPSFLPSFLICKMARQKVTVCLTGDGGDELLGGYTRYRRILAAGNGRAASMLAAPIYRTLLPWLPILRFKGWKLARALRERLGTEEHRYVDELVATEARLRRRLLGQRSRPVLKHARAEPDLAEDFGVAGDLAARMMSHDLRHWLPHLILTKADRASMACGLELRSPLLDVDLLEWAFRLPASLKVGPAGGKLVVRAALGGRVPKELLQRTKRGFGTPLGRWFRRELAPLVDRYLLASQLAADGWLDARAIAAAVRAHRSRSRNLGETLWALLALEIWYRKYGAGAISQRFAAAANR